MIPVKIKKSSRKWEKEAPSTFNTVTSVIYPVLFGAVIFVLWQTQILHRMVHTEEWILPTPSHIGQIIGENLTKLAGNLLMTLIPVIAGLALGSLLGFIVALIAPQSGRWGKGGLAVVSCFSAVPIVALAPVFNNLVKVWISDIQVRGMVSKLLVVTVMCVAGMSYNAYRGLTEVQPFGEDLMATYAADRRTVFIKLRLPNSLPFIFTAMKVNLPVSVISALVSEYFIDTVEGSGSFPGLGRMIRSNILNAQYASAWAYITFACALGIGLYMLLMLIQKRVLGKRAK